MAGKRPDDEATGPRTGDDGETALVERARSGDTRAYDALVRRYETIAFRTAYVIVRSSAEAEDATQEAFFKAYRAIGRFRSGAPFRPWILRIVANEARNRNRSAARRREDLGVVAAEPRDTGTTPEEAALLRERERWLTAAMAELSDDDRLVIAYRWFLDLSEEEMAEVMDVPRGTVKSRLSRAMARLRERLTAEQADE